MTLPETSQEIDEQNPYKAVSTNPAFKTARPRSPHKLSFLKSFSDKANNNNNHFPLPENKESALITGFSLSETVDHKREPLAGLTADSKDELMMI